MTKQRFLMPSQTIYHEIKLYMFEYILACTQFPIFISTHAFDQGHQGFFFSLNHHDPTHCCSIIVYRFSGDFFS